MPIVEDTFVCPLPVHWSVLHSGIDRHCGGSPLILHHSLARLLLLSRPMSWKMNRIAAKDDWEEGKESVAGVTFKERIYYSNHYYGVQDKIKADEVSVPPRANYNIPFLEIWSVCKLIAIAGPRQGSKTQLVIMVLDCVVFARSFRLLSCWCLFKVPIRERASTEMIFDLNIHLCTKSSVNEGSKKLK